MPLMFHASSLSLYFFSIPWCRVVRCLVSQLQLLALLAESVALLDNGRIAEGFAKLSKGFEQTGHPAFAFNLGTMLRSFLRL